MARTIITGAKVHQHGQPWEQGDDELLIENGRVVATGKGNEISSSAGTDDQIVRLPGGRLLPGLFDAHLHLDLGGRLFANLQLVNKLTNSEVLESIRVLATDSEDWLIGIGLNENAWPTLAELDQVCANRPLLLHTRDYHTVRLNSAAIKAIDLSSQSALPEGGWQELDENDRPLGILRENASDWVTQYLPVEKPEKLRHHLRRAMNHLLSLGVTGVSDGSHPTSYETGLKWLEEHEGLPIHVESWLRCVDFGLNFIQQPRLNRERLKRNRIKLFIDGALGSYTAWMKQDYADRPGHTSGPVPDLNVFDEFVQMSSDGGWSLTVHAIGDAAVDHVIEILTSVHAPAGRHRIEHIQHVDAESIQRLRESDLVLSVQPLHRLDDLEMLRQRVGDLAKWAYPLRSLNVEDRLVLGSDWPVVDCDPRKTIRAAMLPREAGEGMPDQHLTVSQSVLAMTYNAARAAGFNDLGSLQAGYMADVVWLDTDPGNDADAWLETRVGAVWKTGERVSRDGDLI